MFAHVKAIEGFMKTDGKLPINVKFLIEGEEEVGSEHLDPWIEKNADKLKCDVVVVSDTAQYGEGIPAITYALRGIAYLEMKVEGPAMDLHSGVFGGTIANPANVLAEILSTIKDRDGRILVDGFYEKVRELSPAERTEIEKLPYDDADFCRGIGVPKTFGEIGFSTIERRWIRPTFDVNGLFGGYQGEGSKTVLPAWAGAKISFRLVPDQDPHEIGRHVKAHIEKVAPPTVKVSVTALHGGHPVLVPIDGEAMQAARRALHKGFNQEPVMIREGGSIPVVSTFQKVLKAPTLLLGFGRNDDGAHSPNEKFNLDDYHNGIRTSAFLLQELAAKA
jgi:acetylornithine deacetylase/succinyl-diaminopimelate desuccinylase-like protein